MKFKLKKMKIILIYDYLKFIKLSQDYLEDVNVKKMLVL